MTPIDLKVKEYIRQFLKNRMQAEKDNTAGRAIGFVVRETDIEKLLDGMWVFINKKLLNEQNEKG
jgi:hypothetical protein